MKKNLALIAIVALIASCNQEDVVTSAQNEENASVNVNVVTESFVEENLDGPSLRVSANTDGLGSVIGWNWDSNDEIGLSRVTANTIGTGASYTYSSGLKTNAMFTGSALNLGNYIGYYPKGQSVAKGGKVSFTLPDQLQAANATFSHINTCGFLYSNVHNMTTRNATEISGFTFKNAFAILKLDIKAASKVSLQQIELSSAVGNTYKFNQTVELAANSVGDDIATVYANPKNVTALYTGANGTTLTVGSYNYTGYLFVAPGGTAGEVIKIRLKTDKGIVDFGTDITIPAGGLVAGKIYKVTRSFTQSDIKEPVIDIDNPSVPTIIGNNIHINRADELIWVSKVNNKDVNVDAKGIPNTFEGYTVTLNATVDLQGVEWTPIGGDAGSKSFKGTFVSAQKGFAIKGLSNSLFGVNRGSINKIIIDGANINLPTSTTAVGALVVTNVGTVTNCHVQNSTIAGNSIVGSLVGTNHNDGTIYLSSVKTSTVSGTQIVGGLVGDNRGMINDSHNEGASVNATGITSGGVAGNNSGSIKVCTNAGRVGETTTSYAGGIVGRNDGTFIKSAGNAGVIGNSNCNYVGTIAGSSTLIPVAVTINNTGTAIGKTGSGTAPVGRIL